MAAIYKVVKQVFRSTSRVPSLLKNCKTYSVLSCKSTYYPVTFKHNKPSAYAIVIKKLLTKSCQLRAMGTLSPLDPSSFSRPELAIIKHISLALNVDFDEKVLTGSAVLHFEVLEEIGELILDVSNQTIESIELDDGTPLKFETGDPIPNYGSKLTITLPKQADSGEKKHESSDTFNTESLLAKNVCKKIIKMPIVENMSLTLSGYIYEPVLEDPLKGVQRCDESKNPCKCCTCSKIHEDDDITHFEKFDKVLVESRIQIRIKYTTAPSATALQWLDPKQTTGKKYPYLFSQCQPIHARSILPCQDTPYVKFTYDAEVTAPEEFTVLMSALREENKSTKTSFRQPIPTPSYLLAIAVAVLENRRLGPRSLVWTEKENVERSAWEFADTEKYLQAAEKLCGPYEWTQYDLLVLPPSFPYGGMENPCLTFVTPSLLAGDRSQADVIVHEIMHSWTGNLVTNRNFEHFWLNEGFTVFLERKIAASLIDDPVDSKKSRDFHSLLGLQELNETVKNQLGPENLLTRLVVDLNGVHPDDAFSTVPYEKGSLFLRYLEDLVGGDEVFDDFLRSYLNNFQKKSLDTDQFKEYLLNYFKDNDKIKSVDWDTWLYKPGMPPIIPNYDTSMTKAVTNLVENIITKKNFKFSYNDVKTFTPHQVINLLQDLIDRPALSVDRLRDLGKEYKIDNSKNTEISYRWLRLCIRSKYQDKLAEVFEFLNGQGRMKYVRPIYRDLYAWEDVRDQAIKNFLENESNMMHVSAYTLRKDLHLNE